MTKNVKSILVAGVLVAFALIAIYLPGSISAGELEPLGPPGPTMKTLDQIPPTWSQILPASDRFQLVMGGAAVLDKETGLTWARDANLAGTKTWLDAIDFCRSLVIGNRIGWRLPTVEELSTLLDMSQAAAPKLPPGHPFINVQSGMYWSITSYENPDYMALAVSTSDGPVVIHDKSVQHYVWPVRGENR